MVRIVPLLSILKGGASNEPLYSSVYVTDAFSSPEVWYICPTTLSMGEFSATSKELALKSNGSDSLLSRVKLAKRLRFESTVK